MQTLKQFFSNSDVLDIVKTTILFTIASSTGRFTPHDYGLIPPIGFWIGLFAFVILTSFFYWKDK